MLPPTVIFKGYCHGSLIWRRVECTLCYILYLLRWMLHKGMGVLTWIQVRYMNTEDELW
jgi:hypothetical protein